VEKLKSGLAAQGIDPRRLRLEFMSLEDGGKFAQAITDFDREIRFGIYRD
jgi:coenzyme F420-reducing hydrogenase delta subunit